MKSFIQSHNLVFPFNGPIEVGLRALINLCVGYPELYSLQRLVVYDYLLVHSGDIPKGPPSLHPSTPHRSEELLVRRGVLQEGIALYESRGLILRHYCDDGIFFAATEHAASFIDALRSTYADQLKDRSYWIVSTFSKNSDADLHSLIREHVGDWGAEFEMESVLWMEGQE